MKKLMYGVIFFGASIFTLNANEAGSLVSSFGQQGVVSLVVPGTTGSTMISGFALSPDSSIVTGGFAGLRGKNGIFLVKYAQNGSLVKGFGNQGIVFTSPVEPPLSAVTSGIPCDWNVFGIKISSKTGKITVGSYIYNGGVSVGLGLGRYNQDGMPDTTFGTVVEQTTGKRNGFLGLNKFYPYALALQNDEKIILAGSASDKGANNLFGLIRYDQNGMLDETFGDKGIVKYNPFPTAQQRIYDIVIQPDGKIITTGVMTKESLFVIVTCRFNQDGSIDQTFNAQGPFASPGYIVATPGTNNVGVAFRVALQSDGKILVAGYGQFVEPAAEAGQQSSSILKLVLLRYNSQGLPDQTFGAAGMVITQIGQWGTMPFGLAVQPDGKIVVASQATFYRPDGQLLETFATARYLSNGVLDATFGVGASGTLEMPGVAITSFSTNEVLLNALMLTPEKITLGGCGMDLGRGFYDGIITQYNQ